MYWKNIHPLKNEMVLTLKYLIRKENALKIQLDNSAQWTLERSRRKYISELVFSSYVPCTLGPIAAFTLIIVVHKP